MLNFEKIEQVVSIFTGIVEIISNVLGLPKPPAFSANIYTEQIYQAGISCLQQTVVGEEEISSYRIIPITYVIVGGEEKSKVILVEDLYSKDRYSSSEDGTCTMLCQDVLDEFVNFIKEIYVDQEVSVDTHYVIEYKNENEVEKVVFTVDDEMFVPVPDKDLLDMKDQYQESEQFCVNVLMFPENKREIRQALLED